MFERFTESARRVIFFAFKEAREVGSFRIETAHLLLGLLRVDKPLAGRVPASSLAAIGPIPNQIGEIAAPKESCWIGGTLPLSEESKRVLENCAVEAETVGDMQIGTEHMLVALLREEQSQAVKVLNENGITLSGARKKLSRGQDL
jgi:ATP-dependent Clp protease ATP-binding subunit ClpC